MSAQNARPAPKGGLTWEREKALVIAAAAPLTLLDFLLETLFPGLPLSAPFCAAILAQLLSGIPFHGLHRSVERARLIRFVTATVLAASAAMVAAALAIRAIGWAETGLPAALAGFGGTMFALYHTHKWLFMAMIERHDAPPDGEEEML